VAERFTGDGSMRLDDVIQAVDRLASAIES